MKAIKPDEFFKQISIHSGVSDLRTIKDIYYGMVRTISRELRDKHIVELPDWGEFVLKVYAARTIKNMNGDMQAIPAKPLVKFVPDHKVKKYFYSLGKE